MPNHLSFDGDDDGGDGSDGDEFARADDERAGIVLITLTSDNQLC